jgi:hypothetical protein
VKTTSLAVTAALVLVLLGLCLGAEAGAQSAPSPAASGAAAAGAAPAGGLLESYWKDPALMKAYLKKAGLAARIELYRAWLGMAYLEEPSVSDEAAGALARDLAALDPAAAEELAGFLAKAMARRAGFWTENGDSRERLAAAFLDRPEPELSASALSLLSLTPRPIAFTRQRAAKLLGLISKAPFSDPESRALWAFAVGGMSMGGEEGLAARRLASGLRELAGYSLWTWASRSASIATEGLRQDSLAAAFSDPKLPAGDFSILYALAAGAEIDSGGKLALKARFDSASAPLRLIASRARSGDSASRDFIMLAAVASAPSAAKSLDLAAIKRLGDWEAGLRLLGLAREGSLPSEGELAAFLEPLRPSQAAAAASLLAGSPSPASVAALSALLADRNARDPALLVVAMRALVAAAASGSAELILPLCSAPAAEVRESAIGCLLRSGDPRLASALLFGLDDAEPALRLAAADGLGSLRDSRAVDPLSALLLDPSEPEDLKRACARSLGLIGGPRTDLAFEKFLLTPGRGSQSDAARSYAAMSLGERRAGGAVDALLRNIDSGRESDLNYHCILALGRIADPAGLRSLYALARAGLPLWKADPSSRTPTAAYWALLPIDAALGRQLYLELWTGASAATNRQQAAKPPSGGERLAVWGWYSALYLVNNPAKETTQADREAWEAYLGSHLAAAVSADCAMAGEAIDRFGPPSLFPATAAILPSLEPYPKSWIAASLIHHAEPSMLPAFLSLLGSEDDFLVYASLASMDHLIPKLPSPLAPGIRASLAEYRSKLPLLGAVQLAGGTREWRDLVAKRLDAILGREP